MPQTAIAEGSADRHQRRDPILQTVVLLQLSGLPHICLMQKERSLASIPSHPASVVMPDASLGAMFGPYVTLTFFFVLQAYIEYLRRNVFSQDYYRNTSIYFINCMTQLCNNVDVVCSAISHRVTNTVHFFFWVAFYAFLGWDSGFRISGCIPQRSCRGQWSILLGNYHRNEGMKEWE